MAGAISFFQKEFGHSLPLSVNRFKKKVKDFQENSYISLISKKFGNQNTRLVSVQIETFCLVWRHSRISRGIKTCGKCTTCL